MASTTEQAARPLGRLQSEVLAEIARYGRRHDRPPTMREIGRAVGIRSIGHVAAVLASLERRGYLTRERGVARGLHLTQPAGRPILGTIAAGAPLDLFDAGPPETLDLAAHARAGAPLDGSQSGEFALRVRGDSMIEDGILDGDYVLVRRADTAPEGAIVVAVHLAADGGERGAATLKRLQLDRRRGRVLLRPANAALEPIAIPAEVWAREWRVQGTVTAIYRPCTTSTSTSAAAPPAAWHAHAR